MSGTGNCLNVSPNVALTALKLGQDLSHLGHLQDLPLSVKTNKQKMVMLTEQTSEGWLRINDI